MKGHILFYVWHWSLYICGIIRRVTVRICLNVESKLSQSGTFEVYGSLSAGMFWMLHQKMDAGQTLNVHFNVHACLVYLKTMNVR
ncbi:hypothetical protein CRYUN_Cryun39dG0032600 [Craigia yunnanensis]